MKKFSPFQIKNHFMNNLPIIMSILILFLSFTYNVYQLNIENNDLKISTSNGLDNFSLELKEQIKEKIEIISSLMLNQWVNTSNLSSLYDESRYLQIVPSFYNYSTSFLAINWVNTSGVINWVYPFERNVQAINKSIVFYPNSNNTINDAFAVAQQNRSIGFSHLIYFIQGGEGFVAYIPIIYNNITTGYFDIVFGITTIVSYLKTFVSSDLFSFKIMDKNSVVSTLGENFSRSNSYVQHYSVVIYNRVLDVYARPKPQSINEVSLFSQFYIFVTEIFLCLGIYYLTNQLKKKNTLLKEDFSQKEHMMEIMYHNKKLEALGSLSGSIAHDFNNILTNMTGHLQIIQSDVISDLKLIETPKDTLITLESSLSALSRNVKRSKEITGQILAFSKQGPIEFQIINLSEIIAESIKLVKETNDNGVIFEITIPDDRYFVYGNQSRLIQVFMNILINSLNAMSTKDPKIQISCTEIDNFIHEQTSQSKIHYLDKACSIKVRDNGIGMSEDQVINAFDPFNFHKSSEKGTGLGLGIVYNNVIAMNGNVSIKSELNEYTEVEIQFPLVKKPFEISEIKKQLNVIKLNYDNLQMKTLLMIDDEIDIINSYSKIFKKYGLKVIGYTLGTDAWEYYKSNFNHIDIVFTDVNLPDIGGFDLISLIKTIKANQKVILMTGYSEYNVEKTEYQIVQKPFDISKILDLLSLLLE